MYEVTHQRGKGIGSLIVKQKGIYYLVSLDMGTAFKADPPDSPDMFLKYGYYVIARDELIDDRAKKRLDEIMSKVEG